MGDVLFVEEKEREREREPKPESGERHFGYLWYSPPDQVK